MCIVAERYQASTIRIAKTCTGIFMIISNGEKYQIYLPKISCATSQIKQLGECYNL